MSSSAALAGEAPGESWLGRLVDSLPVWLWVGLGYAGLTFAIFGDALIATGDLVITHRPGDTSLYFTRFRYFGFSELQNGNLALWNPHIFGGAPFVGTVQSAMLYPLNLIFLFLPVAKAVNVSIAFHHFLTGVLMYAWARNRELRAFPAFFSGVLVMFGAAYFMRAYAGHLTMLNALAWTPLILLSVDKIFTRPSLGWSLVGVFAVSMQASAGYPQSAYASALVLAMYCVFRYVRCERKVGVAMALAPIAVLPALICALPLWTGLEAGGESLRGGGVDYAFATTFSFPPENLLGFLAPRYLGDHVTFPYWGRWSIWDASLYFGVGGFALMLFGIVRGEAAQKRFSTVIMLVMLLICLGGYTPAFRWIFDWVPGFSLFRAPSKYAFHVAIFAALLSGIGLQAVLDGKRGTRVLSGIFAVFSVLFLAAFVALRLDAVFHDEEARWIEWHEWLKGTGEVFLWGQTTDTLEIDATLFSSATMLAPALLCFVVALLLWFSNRSRTVVIWLAVVAMGDVFVHAATYRENFRISDNARGPVEELYRSVPGDNRTLSLSGLDHSVRNHEMMVGAQAMWGYDPLILRRYAEFMEFTQRHDQSVYKDAAASPSSMWDHHFHGLEVTKFPPAGPWPNTYHPLMRMLRCRYVIPASLYTPEIDGAQIVEMPGALPRFYFAQSVSVIGETEARLQALAAPDFDLEREVIVEAALSIKPKAKPRNVELAVLDSGTDHVTLDIVAPKDTFLVMTDVYSEGWRAMALEGSEQSEYQVVPTNHVLRGVPLREGVHRLRIEYAPDSYRIGRWISIGSIGVYLGLLLIVGIQAIAGWAGRDAKAESV